MLLFSQNQRCNLGLPPEFTWEDLTLSSVQHTYNGETFEIIGTIVLEDGASLTFINCDLNMAPNAKIIVKNQSSIYFDISTVFACGQNVWDGIYLEEDAYLSAEGSEFRDAMNTIYSTDISNFDIVSNTFINNVTSLKVVDYFFDHNGAFENNTVTFNSNALSDLYTYNNYGIYCENVIPENTGNELTIAGEPMNTFNNFFSSATPLYFKNSDVNINNANIDMANANVGIDIQGGANASNFRNVKIEHVDIINTSSLSNYCIMGLDYTNVTIIGCLLDNALYRNIIFTNIYGDISMLENEIYSNGDMYSYGLLINNPINSAYIYGNTFNFNDGMGVGLINTDYIIFNANRFIGDVDGIGLFINNSNKIDLDNHNLFNINNNGYGVKILNNSTNINITDNNSFQFGDNAFGIDIENSSKITIDNENSFVCSLNGKGIKAINTDDIIIDRNQFDFTNNGNAIDLDNCDEIDVKNNTINSNKAFAIKVVGSDIISILNNSIEKTEGIGIYTFQSSNFNINANTINFINYTYNSKKAIFTNTSYGNNSILMNIIDMNGYTFQSEQYSQGLHMYWSPTTDVKNNVVRDAGYAYHIEMDNSNGEISCNKAISSYNGFKLTTAIWGVNNGNEHFYIGEPNNVAYDNYWSQIGQTVGRINGDIYWYDHTFIYKNSSNYWLYDNGNPLFDVTTLFNFIAQNSGNLNNYCGTIINSTQSSSLSYTDSLSQLRDEIIGFAIDTNSLANTNSISLSNPQNIYNSIERYTIAKSAYYKLKSNSNITNLGLLSDIKFHDFKSSLDASNLGLLNNIENEVANEDFISAKQYLQLYQPKDLNEINIKNSFNKYIQYLETDSLSSQDSSLLLNIANQHPRIGGQSVFLARHLLNLIIEDPFLNTASSSIKSNNIINSNSSTTNENLSIKIVPNPVDDYINIFVDGELNNCNYIINSIEGKIVGSGKLSNMFLNKIEVKNLNSGIYFIKILDNNSPVFKDKLIKL